MKSPPAGFGLAVASLGCLGAGYLWAVCFGDGLHGLQSTASLTLASSYPDADAAAFGSLALYLLSGFMSIWILNVWNSWRPVIIWYLSTGAVGGLAFAAFEVAKATI